MTELAKRFRWVSYYSQGTDCSGIVARQLQGLLKPSPIDCSSTRWARRQKAIRRLSESHSKLMVTEWETLVSFFHFTKFVCVCEGERHIRSPVNQSLLLLYMYLYSAYSISYPTWHEFVFFLPRKGWTIAHGLRTKRIHAHVFNLAPSHHSCRMFLIENEVESKEILWGQIASTNPV